MINIHAVLPNGHSELLTLLPSCTVQDLRTEAQPLGKSTSDLSLPSIRPSLEP